MRLLFITLCCLLLGATVFASPACPLLPSNTDESFSGLRERASLYGQELQFTLAESCLRQALELYPQQDTPQVKVDLASTLFYLNRKEEAIALYEEVLTLIPADDSAIVHHNLALVYAQLGNENAAEEHRNFKWQQAMARSSTADPVQEMIEVILNRNGTDERRNELRMSLGGQIPMWHFTMLNDHARNHAYARVIEKHVNKDSVVLDIGTGSGLLSMIAARAGAKAVYTCEAKQPIADVAKHIIAKNGYADHIKVIPKMSTQITVGPQGDMPERANVLISEIVDAILLGEGIMGTVKHAQENLIVPNAVVIPKRGTVLAAVMESHELWAKFRVNHVEGFDVSAFNLFHPAHVSNGPLLLDISTLKYRFLTVPIVVMSTDYTQELVMRQAVDLQTIHFRHYGEAHALVVWFQLDLDDDVIVSSGPDNNGNHWQQAVYLFPRSFAAEPHQPVPVSVETHGLEFMVRLVNT